KTLIYHCEELKKTLWRLRQIIIMVWQRVYNGLLKALYWFIKDYIALFYGINPFLRLNGN
ncbi:MAG: hypothetical protein LBU37_01970, partial [Tannerellaceae bacterium]|nr:hypothetical protein [Tannerellaceae bacterium]